MGALKCDASHNKNAIGPVTHVCRVRAARGRIPAGQTANPRKTIKDLYKTVN